MATNRNEFGLTNRNMFTILAIVKNYPEVKEVIIFGSRAKGNFQPGSDIDLAVMNEGVSDSTMRKLFAEFEESSLPYSVDIINFPELNHPELINHIRRVGKEFFAKQMVSSGEK